MTIHSWSRVERLRPKFSTSVDLSYAAGKSSSSAVQSCFYLHQNEFLAPILVRNRPHTNPPPQFQLSYPLLRLIEETRPDILPSMEVRWLVGIISPSWSRTPRSRNRSPQYLTAVGRFRDTEDLNFRNFFPMIPEGWRLGKSLMEPDF